MVVFVTLAFALGFTALVLADAFAFRGVLFGSPFAHALMMTGVVVNDDDILRSCIRDWGQHDGDQAECGNSKGFCGVGHAR